MGDLYRLDVPAPRLADESEIAAPPWWSDLDNLALLLAFLEYEGMPDRPADVIEKAWHYDAEFRDAVAWQRQGDDVA